MLHIDSSGEVINTLSHSWLYFITAGCGRRSGAGNVCFVIECFDTRDYGTAESPLWSNMISFCRFSCFLKQL